MRPRGHEVSANSLRILEACEQQFRWTYGPREVRLHQEAPGLPARVGDLWHRALATLVRDRSSWGVMGPTSTRELLTALDAVAGESQFHAEALLSARDLAEEAVRRLSPYLDDPDLSPLEHDDGGVWVERSFVREIGDESLSRPGGEVAVRVGGIFDLVLASSSGRRIRIVDWKTGPGSFLGEKDARRDPQVLLYLAAAASLWPDADEIDLHLVWIGLDAEPTRVRWSLELDDAAVALARAAVAKIATETDWPARPGDACSRCGFTRYCQERREWLHEGATRATLQSLAPEALSDETLAAIVEERKSRAKEAEKDADEATTELRRRIDERGEVIARGRRFFHRIVAAGKPQTRPAEPRQAYDRLASEPIDENMAPVAGAVHAPLSPVPTPAPATGPLSDALAAAKARTDDFLAAVRAKHTPGDVAGPGPVAAPAPSTSATTPPTSPAEGAPTLSAGGVSLAETDDERGPPGPLGCPGDPLIGCDHCYAPTDEESERERYLETLTRQVEDEIAAEQADCRDCGVCELCAERTAESFEDAQKAELLRDGTVLGGASGLPPPSDVLAAAVARDPVGLACSCGRTFQNRRALSAHARSHRSEASA